MMPRSRDVYIYRSDNAAKMLVDLDAIHGHMVTMWCPCDKQYDISVQIYWPHGLKEQTSYTRADLDLKFSYVATFLKWLKVKIVWRGDKEEGPLLKWTQMTLNFSCPKLAEMLGVQPFQKDSYTGDLHENKTSAPADHVVIRFVHLCHTACHIDITLWPYDHGWHQGPQVFLLHYLI